MPLTPFTKDQMDFVLLVANKAQEYGRAEPVRGCPRCELKDEKIRRLREESRRKGLQLHVEQMNAKRAKRIRAALGRCYTALAAVDGHLESPTKLASIVKWALGACKSVIGPREMATLQIDQLGGSDMRLSGEDEKWAKEAIQEHLRERAEHPEMYVEGPYQFMPAINLTERDWDGDYCLLGWKAYGASTAEEMQRTVGVNAPLPVTLHFKYRDTFGRRVTRIVAEFYEQAGHPEAALEHARFVAQVLNKAAGIPDLTPDQK